MTEKRDLAMRSDHRSGLTGAWFRASRHLLNSVTEANRATLAAFGMDTGDRAESPIPSLSYREPDWSFERTVDTPEQISLGDSVRFTKTIEDADVRAFAQASGDTNRLHLDEAFAEETRFGGRIAHGTLVSGLISAALARLPGLVIYLSQDVRFLDAVELGNELTATVEVVEDLGDEKYRFVTSVENEAGETVVDGEAIVLIDPLPGDEFAAEDDS